MRPSRLRLPVFILGALLVLAPVWVSVQAQEKPPAGSVSRGDKVIGGEEELPLGSHRLEDASGRQQRVYTTGGPSERQKESKEQAREERRLMLENLPRIIIDLRKPEEE